MSDAKVNGVKPHSQTLNHITSYPLISDLLRAYQKNGLGAKSIEVYNSLYKTFAEPVIPLFQTPYSIAAPYLDKVDSMGNSTLDWTDNHFPAVKETNLGNLREKVSEGATYPFKLVGQTRDYVFSTYQDESKKIGGDGFVATGKTILSTELRLAYDAYSKVIDFLGPRGKELDSKFREIVSEGQKKAEELEKEGEKLANDAKHKASKKTDEAKKKTDQTVNSK